MNANKQLLKTSLTSKTASPEFQELSKNVIHLAANQLEQQWKSSHNFDCIEGKYLLFLIKFVIIAQLAL